jgi:anti-anti-sigma regulatory factor
MSRQGSALIAFQGDASIRAAEATRQQLRKALDANDSLEIDFADVEDVDLTFLQPLPSAQLSGQRDGKIADIGRIFSAA